MSTSPSPAGVHPVNPGNPGIELLWSRSGGPCFAQKTQSALGLIRALYSTGSNIRPSPPAPGDPFPPLLSPLPPVPAGVPSPGKLHQFAAVRTTLHRVCRGAALKLFDPLRVNSSNGIRSTSTKPWFPAKVSASGSFFLTVREVPYGSPDGSKVHSDQ